MRHTDNLLKDIHDGLSGRNVGISTGLTKFDEVIAGIQRKSIYNIGAGMGAGNNLYYNYKLCRSNLEKLEL